LTGRVEAAFFGRKRGSSNEITLKRIKKNGEKRHKEYLLQCPGFAAEVSQRQIKNNTKELSLLRRY
jgi:hypothetical protein